MFLLTGNRPCHIWREYSQIEKENNFGKQTGLLQY